MPTCYFRDEDDEWNRVIVRFATCGALKRHILECHLIDIPGRPKWDPLVRESAYWTIVDVLYGDSRIEAALETDDDCEAPHVQADVRRHQPFAVN
jgi:hypothetical protein